MKGEICVKNNEVVEKVASSNGMLIEINEKPSGFKWLILSLQHVFAMFGATVLVPMLTGLPISVALFTSGIGTLIYILCTRAKVPVYLGSSFAYISVIIALQNQYGDFSAALTGLLVVGVIYCIIAVLVYFLGNKWLHKILAPVVIGPMIMIIGLGLSSTAVNQAGLLGGSWKEILTALVSFLIVTIVALKGKGFIKIIPFLIGIIGGYVCAAILGIVDFSEVSKVVMDPGLWFRIPEFMFLGWGNGSTNVLGTEFTFYQMNFAAVLTVAPLAFVTAAEHVGDHVVLGKIVDKDFIKDPGLHRTLLGDGIATLFAAMFGGPANTTYSENTSVVGMTKVASVWVTGLAAVIAVILSFFNIFTTLIASIPGAVMGGISIILYGFIAANGLKVLYDSKVDLASARNMIITAAMLVLGIGGAVIDFWAFTIYGMALAAIVGILLNLFLPKDADEKTN